MKRAVLTAAAASLLVAALAAPADARGRWNHHHDDDVDAGDVVAGAFIVGGIAALLSAGKRDRRARQDAAVDACAGEAEHRGGGELSQVTHVSKRKGYYTVMGRGVESSFTCTVRNGRIYSMQLHANEA